MFDIALNEIFKPPMASYELYLFIIYLFGVLHHFQHCTGHITTGSCKGRGNQYTQLIRVLYCKLLTNGKQLPTFPLEEIELYAGNRTLVSEVGGESVTTLPPWPPHVLYPDTLVYCCRERGCDSYTGWLVQPVIARYKVFFRAIRICL